ncbi:MAG: LTA synthase family protein [Fibrobacteraceae bacterium]|nr:LTA synthase family protein [Fibrobacteraceae bacterium]
MNDRVKKIAIVALKIIAIEECVSYIVSNGFLTPDSLPVSPLFIISFVVLLALYWRSHPIKVPQVFIVFFVTFFAVQLRASLAWCAKTFPLQDANAVLLTLAMPFDEFAYSMVHQYFAATIPNALIIAFLLSALSLFMLGDLWKRLIPALVYFVGTVALFIYETPIKDYVTALIGEPEDCASYSPFFVENYVYSDSVKITVPENKRNLIVLFMESMETSFADKLNGGYLDENLMPELTRLAQQNVNFGRSGNHIGGGFDTRGASHTFGATVSKTLGVPMVRVYSETPAYLYYNSVYKTLDKQNYHQVFFQGNHGLFPQFKRYFQDQTVKEIYGPDDLIERLHINEEEMTRNHAAKSVPDKDAFVFAEQILDTISEPFSLTFFTIDTHSPYGIYDGDCVKATDEKNKDEILKACVQCVSKQLDLFLSYIKSKPFYENTTIVVFGDHLFMGDRLVKESPSRKWVNIFINPAKKPLQEENRIYTDVDMYPTILSAMGYNIEGERLGLGVDLFGNEKTLVEQIGLDSLNKEIEKLVGHLTYESYRLVK